MKAFQVALILLISTTFYQCGDSQSKQNERFELKFSDNKSVFQVIQAVELSIIGKGVDQIDSVGLSIDKNHLGTFSNTRSIQLDLSNHKLGKQELKATIYLDNEIFTASSAITLLAANRATIYTYEILETYPHDPAAYTQGLEFFNDTLYESTGQYKESSLRKINYKTGEILQKIDLNDAYFAEGITILNDQIYQLTWREKTGFIYDLETMERKGSFVYGSSAEGWGLCNDGARLFKSDGSERIWILDSETLAETDYIEIYTNSAKIPRVNELEWVDGLIYANIYQKDAIAIVNPENGAVQGVIDLSNLKTMVSGTQVDVLNGIAYKGEPSILYVTGKNWDKLFKIKVIEK